jgi:hypothetical protein
MFPTFTNLALLGGLAAITAPILIHLLLRRKSQRMRFSTVQFFLKQDEQSMRKRKLRNLLLLATRVLLFTLIALAFARPFLPGGAIPPDEGDRRELVILLDTSASMQAASPGGVQWTRAVEAARKELEKLKMNDRAALITCSTRAELISEFAPASVVQTKLEAVKPSFGKAQLDEGLRQATKVLATANPNSKVEICIISDLQRSGVENVSSTPLPREVAVRIVDLGERFIPNVAVTSLQLESTEESTPQATITSFSDEAVTGGYKLQIDGKEVFAGNVTLGAGAVTNIPLAVPALAPGWHSAEFGLGIKDSMKADDIAYATIFVPKPVHGLVVEPRTVSQVFLEESYFVATALNPVREAGQLSSSRFTYAKTNAEQLPTRLKTVPGQPLVEYLVLPGLKSLSAEASTRIQEFVRSGGGLIIFLGPGTSAITLSKLGEILPAQIGKIETSREADKGWRVTQFDKASAIFAAFREPNSGNLSIPEFTERFTLTPAADSSIVAQFQDGTPFVVARQAGDGRVVLVNSSADTSWTDWQKRKSFVPWLHATARYVTRRDLPHEREALPNLTSGTDLVLDVAQTTDLKRQTLKLQRVGGAEVSFQTDDDGLVQELLLETPGIYILKDNSGREIRRLAANLPTAESDLSTVPPSELEQQIVRSAEPEPQILAAGLFGDSSSGKELWRFLLLSALAVLLIEPILANRMFA